MEGQKYKNVVDNKLKNNDIFVRNPTQIKSQKCFFMCRIFV